MELVTRTLRWQRIALSALLVLAAVGFWRQTYDVFNTFKATLILLGTIAIVGIGAYRASRTRRVHIPRSPVVIAAGALAVAFVVATIVSDTPMLSLVGRPGRHTGLLMYLTYLVLFVATTRLYRDGPASALVKALLGAAVPITAYGLMQAAGVDPYGWQLVEGGPPVFSTFGNANFFAAFLGVVVPLCVWGALTETWPALWRVGATVLGVGAFAATYLSNSQQGPGMALIGSAFVLAVWIVAHPSLARATKGGLLGGGALLGAGGLAALLAGVGPLGGLRAALARSLGTRTPKWETALGIFADHPVFGVGLERFADYFYEYRPVSLAAETGLRRSTDTPHNIPLDMLANGGLLLGITYAAFVGLTGWALVVGLRRTSGEHRLLLAGVGGGWLAYQVQSLVSIDVPPVAVLHYVLAGLIVALGTRPEFREVLLPGAKPVPAPSPRKGKKAGRARAPRAPLVPNSPVVVGLLALLGVMLIVVVTTPVRADMAAARGGRAEQSSPEAAVEAYEQAASIAFWESRYPSLAGRVLTETDAEAALEAQREAAARDPRSLSHALNVANLSASVATPEAATAAWETVLEIDPTTPEVLVDAGTYFLSQGDVDRAAAMVERAVETDGDDPEVWVALGEVRAAEEDPEDARAAFQRALELEPDEAARARAEQGLQALA